MYVCMCLCMNECICVCFSLSLYIYIYIYIYLYISNKTCACLSIYVTKLVRVSLRTCIMVPWALVLTPSVLYDSAHCAHMCPPDILGFCHFACSPFAEALAALFAVVCSRVGSSRPSCIIAYQHVLQSYSFLHSTSWRPSRTYRRPP